MSTWWNTEADIRSAEQEQTKAFLERVADRAKPPHLRNMQLYGVPKSMGYVYVLKAESGLYKIGKAKDYRDRLKTFTVKLPFEVAYELVIATEDNSKLERELHEQYKDKRVRGEWFSLTAHDLTHIRTRFSASIVDGAKA